MRTIIEVCDSCHGCQNSSWPPWMFAEQWLSDISIRMERSDGKVLFCALAKDRCPECIVSYAEQLRAMAQKNSMEITKDKREGDQ